MTNTNPYKTGRGELQHSLLHLLAILASIEKPEIQQRANYFVSNFIDEFFGNRDKEEMMQYYQHYLGKYSKRKGDKGLSFSSARYLKISMDIKKQLNAEERHLVCIRMLEFVSGNSRSINKSLEFVYLISDVFLIKKVVLERMISSILPDFSEKIYKDQNNFHERIKLIYISKDEIYFKLNDYSEKRKNEKLKDKLFSRLFYNQEIVLGKSEKISYSELLSYFIEDKNASGKLLISELNYELPNGRQLYHKLNAEISLPSLVAIAGQSGSGKSTLLKIIAGITAKNKGKLSYPGAETLISYIPQEESNDNDFDITKQLIKSAQLGGSTSPDEEAKSVLKKLGLDKIYKMRNEKVRVNDLSGGERKRLSIAHGLVKNPDVLLCDEPTSGLSFEDSEKIISVLREVSNSGKLVIVSLHQPEDAILNFFDKLLYLDDDAYPVYFGLPSDFYSYVSGITKSNRSFIIKSGRKSSLSLAEHELRAHKTDEFGNEGEERIYPPEFWKSEYDKNFNFESTKEKINSRVKKLKVSLNKRFIWDFKSLFSRKIYLITSLLYAPLMALFLSVLCRFSETEIYSAASNPHLPVFYIILVIVALFGGYVFSMDEISRDIMQRKREWVSERSNNSFLLSRLTLSIPLGLVQALLFAFIAAIVLDISNLFLTMMFVYFVLYLFASSQAHLLSLVGKGKSWVYLMIPVLLIPQIIFSGALIKWDEFPLNGRFNGAPLISRIMPSAWGYEALMTETILSSDSFDFEKDRALFISRYYLQEIIPLIESENNKIDDRVKIEMLSKSIPFSLERENTPESLDEVKKALSQIVVRDNRRGLVKNHRDIWYYLQDIDQGSIKMEGNSIVPGNYDFYFPGNVFSDKSAYIKMGFTFRHSSLSMIMILIFSGFHFIALFFRGKYYPYD